MSKTFGSNLKSYRIMAGFTQDDLAYSAGITRNAVANYESGRSEPNFDVLAKLANALGVDLFDLLADTGHLPNFVRRVQVTDEEWALLQVYREADPVYRTVAMDVLRSHKR